MRQQHYSRHTTQHRQRFSFGARPAGLTTEGIADSINDAERRIRARVPAAKLIFIEPDICKSGEADVGADVP